MLGPRGAIQRTPRMTPHQFLMSPPSLVSVNLATVVIESMLYGVFLMLSGTSLYFQVTRAASQRARGSKLYMSPVFYGSALVVCTVTGHWVLTICRLFDAFITFKGGAAPMLYYADPALITEAVKTAFLIAILITCDVLIIYRLWVVWGYNYYVIIIPCCCLLGLCVAGPGVVYSLTQARMGNSVFIESVGRWITADYSFTFTTNIYCSCGIAWRVWRARQSATSYGGVNLIDVLATVVESATLYTTYVTFFFGSYQASSNIQYTIIDTLGVVAGISFMLINVRAGLGWAQQAPSTASSGNSSGRTQTHVYVMRPVAIDISEAVQTRDDMGVSVGIHGHPVKSELPV
ncbi:hypothetical protein DAEQUDRAFT_710407 [Daedalea quercina L-15889]|uniref:Uncharacterized protein n=1 Tax=Daedalea quercina L-15889 TaxID=1314783 RepID=A0A165QAN6_9APHY|nr:hypothetical protein DAEQUDRAFT_710407 [Daedalea quercina L-15889]